MLILPLLASFMQGAIAPEPNPLQRQVMEVRAEGVFLIEENASHPAQKLSGGTLAASTGPRWQVDDFGLAWIGQRVAMGDSGAWMVGGKELNNEMVGAYATGSDTPLFDYSVLGASVVRPAASNRSGTLAAMVTMDQGTFSFQATVYSWDRLAGDVPTWTAILPNTGNVSAGFVGVNDRGTRTVAAVSNTNGTTHVRVFDSAGLVVNSYDIAAVANIRFGAIDAKGDRLYLGMLNGFCEIYDLNTGGLLHSQSLGGSFDAHAFSGDGKTFAYGNFGGSFVVQETSPGVWATVATRGGVSGAYVGQVALNSDGSRCGFASQRYTPNYDHLEIGMMDVVSGADLFNNSLDAPGTTAQLIASGLDMDDNGDYLAGISWGDSLNLTPEVFVYDATGVLTSSVDTTGSAFGLDMDADGDVLAVGTKAVHANNFGNGGSIMAVDAFEQDFHVVGFPQLGGSLSIETPGGATSFAYAISTGLDNLLTPAGILEINLGLAVHTTSPMAIPLGGLSISVDIPTNLNLLGQTFHAQGLRFDVNNTLTNKVSFDLVP
ncbi:MAG: hypothetical protein O3A95_02075 [Planctomycetota bacterium]|nr:hypothetical protein [Planctomycetota bacterium]MDA1113070.1 hypothetical protein [Planctomycetota bacterium]